MATDIKISELNLISCNNDLNHIIVNDRESVGDEGITKKISLENFLTPNIVKEVNITSNAITSGKIAPRQVDCSKIVNNTITCNQIAACTINNPVLDSNSVDSRVLNNNCGFTVKCLTVNNGSVCISDLANGCIMVESGKTKLNTQTYFWPSAQTANKFLKTNGSGTLTWEEAVPGDSTALVFAEIVPVGTIVPWGGVGSVPSTKWLECDGSKFLGSAYPELSAALLDTWGTRENSGTQFYLPNLKGRTILGAGVGTDDRTESINFPFATNGGEYNNVLAYNQMPAHRHVGSFGESSSIFTGRWGYSSASCGQGSKGGIDQDNNRYGFTTYAGGASDVDGQTVTSSNATPHNNIQPYAVTRYIIKAKPDDIEQFNPIVGPGLSASDANGQTANITLTSTEIGLKVSDDFQFDGSGKLELVDTKYRPGEIIESFSALCNGRAVTLKSGTYTMPDVTEYYFVAGAASYVNNLTFYDGKKDTSYVRDAADTGKSYDILGSLFRYKLPVNAKRIQYSFTYNWGHNYGSANPLYYITPFIGGGEGTTPADETWTRLLEQAVTPAQYGAYDGQHTQHINLEITDTLAEEDVAKGIIYRGNWGSGGRSLLLNCSLYSTSYPVKLYTNYHQGRAALSNIVFFTPPFIEIKTYA